jgi:hypothetical protein
MTLAADSTIPYSTTLTSLLAIRSSESLLSPSIYHCCCCLFPAVTIWLPALPTASTSTSTSTSAAVHHHLSLLLILHHQKQN